MLVIPLVLSGSLAAAAAAALVLVDTEFSRRDAPETTKAAASHTINRAAKADRHAVTSMASTPLQVTAVEVVGVGEVAVVYRDRDGNVLFLTDPARNVTVVAKDVVLPEVTVRQKSGDDVKRLPAKPPQAGRQDGPATAGCDSTVGTVPLTKGSSLLGACLAAIAPTQHAALR
jgi:hypothetical protein